jgi:hypothetical protein
MENHVRVESRTSVRCQIPGAGCQVLGARSVSEITVSQRRINNLQTLESR